MRSIIAFLMLIGSFASALEAEPAPTSSSEIAAAKTEQEVPAGPEIFGVFRGRTPCQELSALLHVAASEACNKVKCRLILYQDPSTKAPTTYDWRGKTNWTGRWAIVKGTKSDPKAIVYELRPPDPQAFLSLLKVDDNILFILGKDGSPLVGNADFSYTLNRIVRRDRQLANDR